MRVMTAGESNPKLAKGVDSGYLTAGLSLAPAVLAGDKPMCVDWKDCIDDCLFHQGRGRVKVVRDARIRKTIEFLSNPISFINREIVPDLALLERQAEKKGLKAAARLNVFSDVRWERYRNELMDSFPNIAFYDYTKDYKRMIQWLNGELPKNYFLAFSRTQSNEDKAVTLLGLGACVAIVIEEQPPHWYTFPTVSGDDHDLIFLHGRSKVITLTPKGSAKKNEEGFLIRKDTDAEVSLS